jgi:hypothetical protein
VLISYIFQLSLAILFGPIINADIFICSLFTHRRNRISRFVSWLRQRHEMCLWSQLLFAISISLACFVHQAQDSCSIYETSIITHLAGLNVTSFVLTMSAYLFPIRRVFVFAPGVAAVYVFTGMTEYLHVARKRPFGRILKACRDVAVEKELPWRKDLVEPFEESTVYPPLFAFTGLILGLTGLWLWLWYRRGRWVGSLSEVEGQKEVKVWAETKATRLQVDDYSRSERVVGVCITLASITLAGMAGSLLEIIMRERRTMILLSNGRTGEHVWGVGQIGALFAWAPLLVEMSWSGVYGCND